MQAFVATHDGQSTHSFSVTLAKGLRDRAGEDEVASRLLVHAMCKASLHREEPHACVPLNLDDSYEAAQADPSLERLQVCTSTLDTAAMLKL